MARIARADRPVITAERGAEIRAETRAALAARITKNGAGDRRYGPRTAEPSARTASPLSLADWAVSRQHAADLSDRGLSVEIETPHTEGAEVWHVVGADARDTFLLWRAGGRIAVQVRWGTGDVTTRFKRSMDDAWNFLRQLTNTRRAHYAGEAAHAEVTLAALPAWLTTASRV